MLVTLSHQPDWFLSYWAWEKGKILSTAKVIASTERANGKDISANQISINPVDNTLVCVTGNNLLKMYRYSEGVMKPLQAAKYDHKNILCHTWTLDDKLLLGTDDGKIAAIEAITEIKWETNFVQTLSQKQKSVYSILAYSKGFTVGSRGGCIALYERAEDLPIGGINNGKVSDVPGSRDLYKKIKEYNVADESSRVILCNNDDSQCIINLAINFNEDTVIASSDNGQIYTAPLTNSEIKSDEVHLENLSQPFHHGMITGMDTCIRKPLIVTCSSDKSVRVWNYLENSSDLVKYFSEEAYSVSIHPSGLYLLVGFSDKLRLMNLLIDDIQPFREFTIRGCRECRFSRGGQYFAAINANVIQIYSTWTFDNLATLKGHNAKVRAISWAADDSRIISAGIDGAIYEWSLKDLSGFNGQGVKREHESVLKSCAYNSVTTICDSKSIYAVGNDRSIKEILDGQIVRDIPVDVGLTQLLVSNSGKMLFVGTTNGSVRSMKFPFEDDVGQFQEHQTHSSAVTRLRASYDDQFLFSAGEDGSLFIFRISDRERSKRDREAIYAEDV
jgi:WD40 repeat protein